MNTPDLALTDCFAPTQKADDTIRGIDLDARLGGAGDRKVTSSSEQRSDLHHRAVDVDAVEQPSRTRHGDGREYAHDAERDRELDEGKRGAHPCFR